MAAREDMGQQVAPGVIQRVSQGLSYIVSGVTPASWFGPSQPLRPLVQDQTEGRQFDYPVGYNLRITPREGEIPFSMLRSFADGYDLLRLAIETRKDQIEAYDWEIVPADPKAPKGAMKDEIKAVTDFLQKPDKELLWPQWLRRMMEELFVIDAMAFYPRADMGGHLYALEVLDGASLKRVLDLEGRTPMPPSPAYQQILHGIPANDLTTDDITYIMRNPRVNRVYGLSPVEQILMTVNIAIRRQLTQLSSYTEGTMPEALAQVPESWTSKMIADFQTWFDGLLAGNIALRRRITFIPKLDNIYMPRAEVMKDEYDDWLARIVCFAFSISPTALIKNPNRATSQSMSDTAKEEGLQPLLKFIGAVMTQLITQYMVPGLRFQFATVNQTNPLEQAQIDDLYIKDKVLTPDEVREGLGREPLTPEQRAEAFPAPPPMLAPGQEKPEDSAINLPNPDKPSATAVPRTNTATDIEKALGGLQLHVHASPVTVDAPVQMGDTHVHVPKQTAPAVTVGAPIVKVYGDTKVQAPPMPMKKVVRARRDPHSGELFGEVTSEVVDSAAVTQSLAKALQQHRGADDAETD